MVSLLTQVRMYLWDNFTYKQTTVFNFLIKLSN